MFYGLGLGLGKIRKMLFSGGLGLYGVMDENMETTTQGHQEVSSKSDGQAHGHGSEA